MSRGPYPLLLMLAMSLPSTVRALGLGEIHVDSALNEPLSAQIDLIGATPQELLDLRAAIANKDIFQRYNADRPAFLNSAKFRVGRDAEGRPVLTVHSEDAFTDPLVSLLVDLRWPHGEVVREYSLLLDPPGFNSHPDSMLAAAPSPATEPVLNVTHLAPNVAHPAPVAATGLASGHYRVADKDTLRGIARRAGAASEPDAQRLMIAIFRANPHAFAGNINRLHRGADLLLPGPDVVAAIAAADAKREVRAHMSAWRMDGRPAAPAIEPVAAATAVAMTAPATAVATATPPDAAPSTDVLKGRVQSLEQSLDDMKKILASEDAKMLGLQKQVTRAAAAEPASASQTMATTAATLVAAAAAAEPEPAATTVPARAMAQTLIGGSSLAARVGPFAVLAGVLVAGFALFRYRRLEKLARPMRLTDSELTNTAVLDETQAGSKTLARDAAAVTAAVVAPPTPVLAAATKPAASDVPSFPKMPARVPSGDTTKAMELDTKAMEMLALDAAEYDPYGIDAGATAKLPVAGSSRQSISRDAQALAAVDLDFNLMDLGATGEHVQMPSGLHDQVVVAESRTNIVEVLKEAIDRDPQRRDLRIKLLEVYYSAAATNQRAFVEIAAALSHEREHLSRDEWDKVARMGREIAAGNRLFAERTDGDELAVA